MREEDEYADWAKGVLREIGLPVNHESLRQAEVLGTALMLHAARTSRHGEVWKASGWRGMLVDARKKIERLWNEFMVGSSEEAVDMDSAYDAINYLVFFIRAHNEDVGSAWDWGYDASNGRSR